VLLLAPRWLTHPQMGGFQRNYDSNNNLPFIEEVKSSFNFYFWNTTNAAEARWRRASDARALIGLAGAAGRAACAAGGWAVLVRLLDRQLQLQVAHQPQARRVPAPGLHGL